MEYKQLILFLAVVSLFSGGITAVPVFADGDDVCEQKCKGVTSLTLRYTGPGPVTIEVKEKENKPAFATFTDINSGDTITVTPPDGKDKLKANTVFEIFDDGTLIDSIKIHTSCSKSIEVEDIHEGDNSSLEITAIDKIFDDKKKGKKCKDKEPKTLESVCEKKLDKKKLNFDGLICQAILELQAIFDIIFEIETQVEQNTQDIARIDAKTQQNMDAITELNSKTQLIMSSLSALNSKTQQNMDAITALEAKQSLDDFDCQVDQVIKWNGNAWVCADTDAFVPLPGLNIKTTTLIAHETNGGPSLSNGDVFGLAAAGIGDIDDDGVRDVVASAPGDDDAGSNSGSVYVLFLNSDGTAKSTTKIGHNLNGGPSLSGGDLFGRSVGGIGDLDNDGVEDIAVGADGDDTGGSSRGAVHILFLNTDGTAKSTTKIAHQTNGGPSLNNNDLFGSSISGLGDLDNDGVEDIVVGARADDTGGNNRGAVYILFLNTDGSVKSSTKIAHQTNGGPPLTGALFGASSPTLGDVDGDGVVDIAVGAPEDNEAGSNKGAVYVLFLNVDGTVKSFTKFTEGLNGGPSLGTSPKYGWAGSPGPGDLDNDGIEDVVNGAFGGDASGRIFIALLNNDGTVKSTIQIADELNGGPNLQPGDSFGFTVAGLGDIDGNGVLDIAVGAPDADTGGSGRGALYIFTMQIVP